MGKEEGREERGRESAIGKFERGREEEERRGEK